eukprot:403356190
METIQEISSAQWYQTLSNKINKEFKDDVKGHKKNQFSIQEQTQKKQTQIYEGNSRKSIANSENESQDSPQTFNHLLKKLNKPEMLLINHLQNQIKQYYPDQIKNYKWLQQELGLSDTQSSNLRKSIEETNREIAQLSQSYQVGSRKQSDNQIHLPVSLKAKMKNLIQTLEKEQNMKKRPSSQQTEIEKISLMKTQTVKMTQQRDSSVRPNSISSNQTKLSEQQKSKNQNYHLSTQSQSPRQKMNLSQTTQLYKPQLQRPITPLLISHKRQQTQQQNYSKESTRKIDSSESERANSYGGSFTPQSGLIEIKSLMTQKQRNMGGMPKQQTLDERVVRNTKRQMNEIQGRQASSGSGSTQRQSYQQTQNFSTKSAYVQVLDKMKSQLKKNNLLTTQSFEKSQKLKRNLNDYINSNNQDQPVINLTTSSRESSNKPAIVSATQDFVQFFN